MNTDDLTAEDRETLFALIERAEPHLRAAPEDSARAARPDIGVSRITVERDGDVTSARWSDPEMPDAGRELARWIEARSR